MTISAWSDAVQFCGYQRHIAAATDDIASLVERSTILIEAVSVAALAESGTKLFPLEILTGSRVTSLWL